jgi:hypothetical protein
VRPIPVCEPYTVIIPPFFADPNPEVVSALLDLSPVRRNNQSVFGFEKEPERENRGLEEKPTRCEATRRHRSGLPEELGKD